MGFFKKIIWKVWEKIEIITKELTDELRESRTILNWLYCIGFMWLTWYCVTRNPASMNTALTVNGAVVSAIFAAYVFTKGKEKVTEITEAHKTKRSNGKGKHEDDSDGDA